MMLLFENMRLAFLAIRINKMRSFLTMLGMIIGISSVIAIVSIGDTMRGVMAEEYSRIGLTRAIVYVTWNLDDRRSTDYFTYEDFEKVEEVFKDSIDYVDSQAYESSTLKKGKSSYKINLNGVKANYEKVQPTEIVYGRMINQSDVDAKKFHIVIEDKTAMKLFGKENAVGETVRATIKGAVEDLLIVGIYHTPDSILNAVLGSDNSDNIFIAESVLTYQDSWFSQYNVYFKTDVNMDTAKTQFVNYVARATNRNPEDIVFYAVKDEMSSMDGMMASMSLAVGAIAAISLLVGGIGIMNIMLVSVTERTREIGIRKALGARTKDVMIQFLTESAIISAVGGIIGTGLGIGVVVLGGSLLGVGVIINPNIVLLAVAFSAVVGIFFGLYPASKAAKADPINALRYE